MRKKKKKEQPYKIGYNGDKDCYVIIDNSTQEEVFCAYSRGSVSLKLKELNK